MAAVPSARGGISDAYRLIKQHGISGALKPTERAKLKQAWNALVGSMVTLEARGANLTGNEEKIVNGILGGDPTDLFARGLRGDESFLQALQNAAKYVETRAASIVDVYTKPFSAKTDYPWDQDAQLAAQPGPPSAQPAPHKPLSLLHSRLPHQRRPKVLCRHRPPWLLLAAHRRSLALHSHYPSRPRRQPSPRLRHRPAPSTRPPSTQRQSTRPSSPIWVRKTCYPCTRITSPWVRRPIWPWMRGPENWASSRGKRTRG